MFSLVLCLIHVFSKVYLTVSRIACSPGLALAPVLIGPVLIGPLPGNAVPLARLSRSRYLRDQPGWHTGFLMPPVWEGVQLIVTNHTCPL